MRASRKVCVGLAIVGLVLSCGGDARAELPQCFDVAPTNDDYRIGYSMVTGIWNDEQVSFHHRALLQIPLWGAAAGVQVPFANAYGDVTNSSLGNLRMYAQYFYTFQWARRANVWVGGGIDVYIPSASALDPQAPETQLISGIAIGDSSLTAPDLDFGIRPRLHIAGEAWIFSLQAFGGFAVQFLDDESRSAFEWGVNFSAQATDWLVISAEATGVSWMVGPPSWMTQRLVTLGAGFRFVLPAGFLLGLWARAPAAGGETTFGEGVFVGFDLLWRHDRNWVLF
jgi:hypothetical protein